MAISYETREDFMQSIYDMFSDDGNNDRANQIIDIFDIATENCIELPCKVGDTVYRINAMFSFLPVPKAEKIQKIELYDINIIFRTVNRAFNDKDIGKTVFLTREEATKALEVRENNG